MNFFGGGKEVKPSYKLPDEDAWGNYWLSRGTNRVHGPVILHGGKGMWFVSRGGDQGVLFDGPVIQYFDSPEKALEALNGSMR